ncbi:MAG: hypothetical protein HY875_04415 [Chloroflexi bacterium]|nr:hypothetical protein [Chloroflexota bacterium]
MGFYYGSGEPPQDEKPGGFKETILIIWAVFSVLALPMGIILGVVAGLVLLFFLFSFHVLAGLAAIVLIIAAVAARGAWEAKHPPEIR